MSEACALCLGPLVCCGWKASVQTKFSIAKWYYCVGFMITAVATWVLRDYTPTWFSDHLGSFDLCANSEFDGLCGSKEIAMRISFANFVFFAAHLLGTFWMVNEDDIRVDIHGGLFFLKTLIWLGTLIGFFFVPNNALYGYAQVARIGSGLFLVFQLILLVAFIYEVNEWLVARYEEWWSRMLLLIGTVAGYCMGLALIAISYHFYATHASCALNVFYITWSLIMGLAMTFVLFVPNRLQTAGLMTSAMTFAYCCYLMYSALNSEPPGDCIRGDGTSNKWILIVGFFIALATVAYSTLAAGVASRDMFGSGAKGSDIDGKLPYRADFFHLIFALASMYIAMLFSNWEISPSTSTFELDWGWISTWVKIVSEWVCALLYIWTVVAPALFPDRDFGPPI